jgi:hypothetical protein
MAPVARRHVVGHRGVLVGGAHALMGGDALAPGEELDGAGGEPRLDFDAGEAMGDAVVVALDLDMVVDADAAHAPLGEHVGLGRQRLERRPVDLFEQLAAGHAQPPDRPRLVEVCQELAKRGVDLGEAEERAVAQTAEQPALDQQDAQLDLGLPSGQQLPAIRAIERR